MAQYFREFRDLTSDYENFPHENLVLLWAWLSKRSCVRRVLVNVWNLSMLKQLRLSQTLYAYFQKTSKSCLPNPQGRPFFLQLWAERQRELSARASPLGGIITKKCSDHEIFITKIFFHGIFSSFTKFLDHENLELYGMHNMPVHH